MNSSIILEALERLGPERVERGLRAFREADHSFYGCFLALCYGPYGELARLMGNGSNFIALSAALGLDRKQRQAIIDAFDGDRILDPETRTYRCTGPEEGFEELCEFFLEEKRNAAMVIEEPEMACVA